MERLLELAAEEAETDTKARGVKSHEQKVPSEPERKLKKRIRDFDSDSEEPKQLRAQPKAKTAKTKQSARVSQRSHGGKPVAVREPEDKAFVFLISDTPLVLVAHRRKGGVVCRNAG